jgi:large subunit ribosomal protein L25
MATRGRSLDPSRSDVPIRSAHAIPGGKVGDGVEVGNPGVEPGSLHSAAVAGERVKLVVQNRSILGSAESRRLRRQGLIPGVLYGRERPVAISIPERDLRAALTGAGGTNAVLDVVVDGGSSHASVLKEYQLDAVRGTVTHIDLQEVRLDQTINATVTLHVVGEAAGTKEGGVLSQSVTEITVEALPLEVPALVEFDVSDLHIGESAHLSQIALPEGVTLIDDGEAVFVSVTQPSREEAEPGEGDEAVGEAAADEAAAEGASDAGSGDDGEPGTVEG